MAQIRVHRNHLAYYESFLSSQVLDRHLRAGRTQRRTVHFKTPTGSGKTRALIEYIRDGRWTKDYTSVIVFVNSHWQVQELYKQLIDCGLSVGAYPQRDPDLCGELSKDMALYEDMHLPTLAEKRVCKMRCSKCAECPFAARLSARWAKDFDVIIAPEQLLTLVPRIAFRWAKHIHERVTGEKWGSDTEDASDDDTTGRFPPALVILDEVKIADEPFIHTFKAANITMELKAIEKAIPLNDQALKEARSDATFSGESREKALNRLLRFQRQLSGMQTYLRWLRSDRSTVRPGFEYTSRDVELFVQEVGADYVETYRSRLQLINTFRRARAWDEGDRYAVRCVPLLPESFVTVGAYLEARFVQRRFQLVDPIVVGDGDLLRVPGTTIWNLQTTAMTVGNWDDNEDATCSLIADIIAKQRQVASERHGEVGAGSVVLVSRKDSDNHGVPYMTNLRDGVLRALSRRGITDTSVVLSDDPSLGPVPDPRIIPMLHYNQTGINAFKGYQTAICGYTYQVPDYVIAEAAFGDRAPSERPRFRLVYDAQGHRSIAFEGDVADSDRELLELVLFRKEVDTAFQAISRVRQNIEPRTIIMSVLHREIERHLGPVNHVTSYTEFRERFGLPTTKSAVKGFKLERAVELHRQGLPLKVIASMVGLGYSTLKQAFIESGIAVRRGRPAGKNREEVPVP